MQHALAPAPHSGSAGLPTRTSPLQPSRSSNSVTPIPAPKSSRSSPSPHRPALKKYAGVGPSATTAPLFAVATPTGAFAIPPSSCHSPGYSSLARSKQGDEASWKRFSSGTDWAGSRALDEDLELDSDDDDERSTSSGTRRTSTSSASSDPDPSSKPVVRSSLVPTAKPFVFAPKPPPAPSGTRRVFSAPESGYPSPVSEPYTPPLNTCHDLHPDASPWAPRPAPGPRFQQQQPTPWPTTRPLAFPPTPPYHSPELLSRSYFPTQRSPSSAQLAAYFGPSPHDAFPEPDEDALYLLARQTFVQQSLLTFPSPSLANPAAMMQHFDRAMASTSPLACLYGIGLEQAERLLEDPERSGVGEPVLALVRLRRERRMEVCGPSANNRKLGLYKTELCRSWEEKGNCRYGTKCQFAHGKQEVREVPRHPKFKSEVCRTFWLNGSCPYGRRCCFIHATLPGDGSSPSHSAPELLGPIPLESPSDSAPPPASRLALRMSSNSSAGGNGPFGPALATYLGPAPAPTNEGLFGISFDQQPSTHLGLGIKLPGRFTNNPTEVPPTFQDPPQSRLARLATLPSHRRSSSTSSVTSDLFQRHGSSSSLSSLTGVGTEWLGSSSSASLDWSAPPATDENISHRLSDFRIQ